MKAYVSYWKGFFDFSGKSTRTEFWMPVLFNILISIGVSFLLIIFKFLAIIPGLFALAILIPSLAVSVRRLRDAKKSFWNFLWYLLPIIGEIVLIVKFCAPSK